MKNYNEIAQSVFERRDEYNKRKKKRQKILLATVPAWCVCVLAAVGIALWQGGVFKTMPSSDIEDSLYPGITDYFDGTDKNGGKLDLSQFDVRVEYIDGDSSEENVAYVPRWDELTIAQQYSELEYNGVSYSSRNTEIAADMLTEALGEFTAYGIDEYTDIRHEINTDVYAIRGISSECAVAVRYEGRAEYYVYVNAFYNPSTLGQFIDDLNLKENLSFGTVRYHYSYGKGDNYVSETIRFDGIEPQAVWDMLLSFTEKADVWTDEWTEDGGWYGEKIGIGTNIPVLGYENIGLWLTEDGHLCTNILATGKAFYIGEINVQQFTEYLFANYDGYIIKYSAAEEEE